MEWMLELGTGAFRGKYLPYSVNSSLHIFMMFTAASFPKDCGKLRASSVLWSQRVWIEGGQVLPFCFDNKLLIKLLNAI